MDQKWFKEDRALPQEEQKEAIEQSKKALKNSTLFQRRLERILNEELDKSYRIVEDFKVPNWERIHVSEIARRKTLREIIKLIQLGG